MESSDKAPSRKKFLLFTAAALCTASIARIFITNKKNQPDPVKMLTQDGKLVEIDRKHLGTPGTKISNPELQRWVKNNGEKNKKLKS